MLEMPEMSERMAGSGKVLPLSSIVLEFKLDPEGKSTSRVQPQTCNCAQNCNSVPPALQGTLTSKVPTNRGHSCHCASHLPVRRHRISGTKCHSVDRVQLDNCSRHLERSCFGMTAVSAISVCRPP